MFTRSFALVIIFFLASVTYAQEIRNPTAIGPQLGWHKAADADEGKFMFGAAIRLQFTQAFGFEGSINYRVEDYRNESIVVRTWPVMLTGIFYPTPNVYGAAGVGWYNTQMEFKKELADISDKTSQEFGWHFGAGVEFPLSKKIILTGDFRYVFIDYNFEDVPGSSNINSDFFVVTSGLLFVIN